MKRIYCLIIATIIMLATGCLSTPDQEYVTHKDSDEMLDKAGSATPAPDGRSIRAQYGFPETVSREASYVNGHLVVSIDAGVEVPELASIPILRVEREDFSQDLAYSLFRVLCAGRDMRWPSDRMSKAQLAETIAMLEERLQYAINDDDREEIMEWIDIYREQYETAPEEIVEEPCDGTFREMPKYTSRGKLIATPTGFNAISHEDRLPVVFCSLENPDPSAIGQSVGGEMALSEAVFSYSDERHNDNFATHEDGDTHLEYIPDVNAAEFSGLPFTPADAVEAVSAFWREVGETNIIPDSVFRVGNTIKPSYQINCVRLVSGAPCANCQGMLMSRDFTRMWSYEEIRVCVDEEGVWSVLWSAPLKITETVMEHTALLDFDRVMELFLNQIEFKYSSFDEYERNDEYKEGVVKAEFEITRVTLVLQRVSEKNNFDTAMLVPVWCFFGRKIDTVYDQGQEKSEIRAYFSQAVVLINAIDGTVIDPAKGW